MWCCGVTQVQDARKVHTKGCSISDNKWWVDAGWDTKAQLGLVCYHLDGAWVWQAHHGFTQQELCWHGWVPYHHWPPGLWYLLSNWGVFFKVFSCHCSSGCSCDYVIVILDIAKRVVLTRHSLTYSLWFGEIHVNPVKSFGSHT